MTMIFTGKRTCENCSHRNVCSIKNDFMEFARKANERIDANSQSFDFLISCKEFREDVAVRTPFGK